MFNRTDSSRKQFIFDVLIIDCIKATDWIRHTLKFSCIGSYIVNMLLHQLCSIYLNQNVTNKSNFAPNKFSITIYIGFELFIIYK